MIKILRNGEYVEVDEKEYFNTDRRRKPVNTDTDDTDSEVSE